MNEESVNRLFEAARNEPAKVPVRDVRRWIGLIGMAALAGSVLLKMKLVLTKKILLMTFITSMLTATVGVTVFVAVRMTGPASSPEPVKAEKPAKTVLAKDLNGKEASTIPADTMRRQDSVSVPPVAPTPPPVPLVPRFPFTPELPALPALPAAPLAPIPAQNPLPPIPPARYDEREVKIGSFDKLTLSGAINVVLIQGKSNGIRIVANGDCGTETVKVTHRGNRLDISSANSRCENYDVLVYLTFTSFSEADLSGASGMVSQGKLTFDRLDIESSGAASVNLELEAKTIAIVSEGASAVDLKGKTTNLKIDASGASSVDGDKLAAEDVHAESSGASQVIIRATKKLKADASGTAHIKYQGKPSEIAKETSGLAVIEEY